ncbi:MarR family transcriptional regulator [Oxalobacteraceae bacterium OM1]|nr:MarR family transcriptional regulator [Oxalobacteraceae bacterium OM1]
MNTPTDPLSSYQPYDRDNYSPQESIGYLLKRVGAVLTLSMDRHLSRFDLTHAQLGIFIKLLHGEANTAADLARELLTDTGAMTRMLDRLEEKGLVQRTRSCADRRVVQVELTAKGRQMADDIIGVAIDNLNHHLRGFNADEVAQFKGFLRRMIANT